MCGIIAVVRQRPTREPVELSSVLDELVEIRSALEAASTPTQELLDAAASRMEHVDRVLQGVPGLMTMLSTTGGVDRLRSAAKRSVELLAALEESLDDPFGGDVSVGDSSVAVEATNAAMIRCKDALWSILRDRLRAATSVESLVPNVATAAGLGVVFSLHQALSAIDRLEVRGRDSAGVEVQLTGHGLSADDSRLEDLLEDRSLPSFTSGAVRFSGDVLVIVYKAAAEIGELGDNTAALRSAISTDPILRLALDSPDVEAVVLGHTRWASIGIISEPNAHPQSSDELSGGSASPEAPLVTAVLNGDVDNHADLTLSHDLRIAAEITTDAKVIPTVFARNLGEGLGASDAFRETVAALEGSVAVAAATTGQPDRLYLALRGSGQAQYIGLAEDAFIVASEPYGVVEDAKTYIRMDGETPSDPSNPTGSRGQVIELSRRDAGTLAGVRRWSYDSSELLLAAEDVQTAEVTTRDIDRGDYPHFLLKEITASPMSFRKTLRGKLVDSEGVIKVVLGVDSVPREVREALASGNIKRVQVIGQGTAAIAGQSLAHHLSDFLVASDLRVEAILATELSGFGMRADMSDTLVIAISQSGTTTDTNRTVDLVRSRGARVIAIVNRRGSDLTDKADGVLYTSDGRDVEMSVASTKAFYSQVAAGLLLAQVIADEVPGGAKSQTPQQQDLLRALLELPERMEETLTVRHQVAAAAEAFAPSRRYWAIVGNGVNHIAAREIRVKLSELCYKSIACDGTEDKKHIDLSSEPMILVCAAGLIGSTADDVAKEVAIFRAHKAAPIVIASQGDRAFPSAMAVISVPETHERLAFILSTMAGHLFGYEAALAIDSQAKPLRQARAAIDAVAARVGGNLDRPTSAKSDGSGPGRIDTDGHVPSPASSIDSGDSSDVVEDFLDLVSALAKELTPVAASYLDQLRSGALNGHLEASTAARLAGHFRYATGVSSLDSYQLEFGKVGSPGIVLEDLSFSLSEAIEELTRPIDAIKHQAKTVTVGISRSDESLLQVPFVTQLLSAGSPRDRLTYGTLRSVAELDPAVVEVTGFTRYGLDHGEDLSRAGLVVVDRGGISVGLQSRVDRDPRLRGTKALVAREQELMVARGRSDGRMVVIVPEIKDGVTTGLQLLHVVVADRLSAPTARSVMEGYRRRYQALRDAVTETEDVFRDDLLADQPVDELLTIPILDLADRWRS